MTPTDLKRTLEQKLDPAFLSDLLEFDAYGEGLNLTLGEIAEGIIEAIMPVIEAALPQWEKFTRLTVVDDSRGRVYERYGVILKPSVQDDGRTLKLFVSSAEPPAEGAPR